MFSQWALPLLLILALGCDPPNEDHPFKGITRTSYDSTGNPVVIDEDPDDWQIGVEVEGILYDPIILDPNVPFVEAIYPAVPNPASDSTDIWVAIESKKILAIWIIDKQDQIVKTFIADTVVAGYWLFTWFLDDDDGQLVSNGVYRCLYNWDSEYYRDGQWHGFTVTGHGDIEVDR